MVASHRQSHSDRHGTTGRERSARVSSPYALNIWVSYSIDNSLSDVPVTLDAARCDQSDANRTPQA
jgi:hypothetical protein